MEHLWSEIDEAVLQCLADGLAEPAEIGEHLGMSEAAAASVLAMLAAEGKVRLCRARPVRLIPIGEMTGARHVAFRRW